MRARLQRLGIQNRVLLTTAFVLVACLSLAGWVLDRSFRASVVANAEEQLTLVVYSLMAAATDRGDRLSFEGEMPDPRLEQPDSGWYAQVYDVQAQPMWRSPNFYSAPVALEQLTPTMAPGLWEFVEVGDHFALNYTVIWELAQESTFAFSVGTAQAPFDRSVRDFRRNLWLGFGGVILLLVLAQFAAVRWGLRPLRAMAEEVQELEAGARDSLSGVYPRELNRLAANLDRFVEHERRNRARYRNAMDDLAHSLKTPLAVLRNALSDQARGGARTPDANGHAGGSDARLLMEQLDRMENTVSHQLSRAAMTGPIVIGADVGVAAVVNRLTRALETAYRERRVRVAVAIDEALTLRIDERDFMEMLGNVLENAFKYTHSKVRIEARTVDDTVELRIDDDGPGIPESKRESVLHRGIRADTKQQGQGIGLSVVYELVTLYQGQLDIRASKLGGAQLVLRLPGRAGTTLA